MTTSTSTLRLRALPAAAPDLRAALGTVPGLFRLSDDPAAAVTWLAGGPGWAAQADAALTAGARLVVLDTDVPVTPDDVARFSGRPVVLHGPRTHAPQLRRLAQLLPGLGAAELVDLLVVDGSDEKRAPDVALWDAVSMLTAVGLDLDVVPRVTGGDQVVMADAIAGTARVHLTCVHRPGATTRTSMKIFTPHGSVEAAMGDPTVALPGQVLVVTADGGSLVGTAYETSRRVALRDAHAALTGDGAPPPPGLIDIHSRAARLFSQVSWVPGTAQSSPQPEGAR
ncbi:hypothetical protein Xcel_1372 [Xylanimonas cellulosilytica DSM 15894]|uniref:Uncharacterized protein n=1 Tax=Xylanimonas cellulosilytica (strain DSM 15894 / JCM 12276 / CECT 5975 / KCTC 9989 / LMG 20990 / NBRC 107835 / XIL07) TaxID=446471 RepID=D1BRE8_XYLCX|nr:hypothetical protein [Xylanimonas cellulosilytica]ACZ30403.1 hypothetical protein Xcel_1372 [Xylanimonas cellulosilytica DSM 15894]